MRELKILHPRAKLTGSGISIAVSPATTEHPGYILIRMFEQVGKPTAGGSVFAYSNPIWARVFAEDIWRILTVLNGYYDSLEGGSILDRRDDTLTEISFRRALDPEACCILEMQESHSDDRFTRINRIVLTLSEALGIKAMLESVMNLVVLGVPGSDEPVRNCDTVEGAEILRAIRKVVDAYPHITWTDNARNAAGCAIKWMLAEAENRLSTLKATK